MSEEKLSNEQVPAKFAEWLLTMGCAPEDVPPLETITEICRGQHLLYVWRNLMEHVGPKDKILQKKHQVFSNDIKKCQKKNAFNELDGNTPKELQLWHQHTQLKQQVVEAEGRVAEERANLNQLLDKVSSKLAHVNLNRKRLQDARRRSWLIQQVGEELKERKSNLHKTRVIADSLRSKDESQDIEGKLDKCLSSLSRAATASHSVANPAASFSANSISDNDAEEYASALAKCRGDVVFKLLLERLAGLRSIAASHSDETGENRMSPQSVLAHTAALQCTLALEALKNRVLIQQTSKRMEATLTQLSEYLSGEACELLVVRCEQAYVVARGIALRSAWDELRARDAQRGGSAPATRAIQNVDKLILSKKDELKRLLMSVGAVERKTQRVRYRLVGMFSSFHTNDNEGHMSIANTQNNSQSNSIAEPISALRQFYEERKEKSKKDIELSMNLDVSEGCSYDLTGNKSPKFADELRMYLNKFSLENNRKLVLSSGEKIWVCETMQSALERMLAKWQDDDVTTSLICPSVGLDHNLARLAEILATRSELETLVRILESGKERSFGVDISSTIEEEQEMLDKIKKRLNESILSLQKTNSTFDVGMDNLRLWGDNVWKQYISGNRTVDGKTFVDYERCYLECLRL